jgi:hypothetical protein
VLAVLALTLPVTANELGSKRPFVRPSTTPVTGSDWRAVAYLARASEPGGVLASFALARYIPGETGRRTNIGDVFWSEPDPQQRQVEVARLLAGQMTPAQAQRFVTGTGARFLLADCATRANLQRELAPVIRWVRRFGCATVYQLDQTGDEPLEAARHRWN